MEDFQNATSQFRGLFVPVVILHCLIARRLNLIDVRVHALEKRRKITNCSVCIFSWSSSMINSFPLSRSLARPASYNKLDYTASESSCLKYLGRNVGIRLHVTPFKVHMQQLTK